MTSHSLHLGGRLSGRWEGAHRGFRYTVVAYALAAFVQSCLMDYCTYRRAASDWGVCVKPLSLERGSLSVHLVACLDVFE